MRFEVDSSWWRRSNPTGETLVAGSPLRVMRLDSRAGRLLDTLESGNDVASASPALIERLSDNGAIHPLVDARAEHRFGCSDVSVVIPVHDERHHEIAELVRSLSAASRVIVVDDGSTIPLAPIPGAEVVRRDTAGGPGAARNTGLAMIDSALVLFVDADVIWNPDAWGVLLAHFDDDRVGVVAPRVTSDPGPSLLARYERSNSPLDLGAESARVRRGTRVSYVPAATIATRRIRREKKHPMIVTGHQVLVSALAIKRPACTLPRPARRTAIGTRSLTVFSLRTNIAVEATAVPAPNSAWPNAARVHARALQRLMRNGVTAPGWRASSPAAADPYDTRCFHAATSERRGR